MTSQDPNLQNLTQHIPEPFMENNKDKGLIDETEEETVEIEGVPFQHEDDETFQLRATYEHSLRQANPDLNDETIIVISSMVVKKARYGVNYEEDVEQLIETMNASIHRYYLQTKRLDLNDETITLIAPTLAKEARYNVVYETLVDQLVDELNQQEEQ